MSEDAIPYDVPESEKRRDATIRKAMASHLVCNPVIFAPTEEQLRAARLAHIGELAIAWRKMNKEAERRERLDDSDQYLVRLRRAEDDAYLALIKACDEVQP